MDGEPDVSTWLWYVAFPPSAWKGGPLPNSPGRDSAEDRPGSAEAWVVHRWAEGLTGHFGAQCKRAMTWEKKFSAFPLCAGLLTVLLKAGLFFFFFLFDQLNVIDIY